MIPRAIILDIVTPERPIVHESVDEIVMPGADGAFGVLPGHAPLLAQLRPGELWYRKGTDKQYLGIDFGLAEVLPDRVTVMVTLAERAEEIDVARVEATRQEAEEQMRRPVSDEDAERARIAMLGAVMRLRVAERARMRRG